MLKEIYINNFKALMNFRIELDKLTVVAGDNAYYSGDCIFKGQLFSGRHSGIFVGAWCKY